jgi:hypothetical protein
MEFVEYTRQRLIGVLGKYPEDVSVSDTTATFKFLAAKDPEKDIEKLNQLFSFIDGESFISFAGRYMLVTLSQVDLLTPHYSVFLLTRSRTVIEHDKVYTLCFSDNGQCVAHLDDKTICLMANGVAKQLTLSVTPAPENKPEFLHSIFERIFLAADDFSFKLRKVLNWKPDSLKICK